MLVVGALIAMDIFWAVTMTSVWESKPFKNSTGWGVFDALRTFTLIMSYINIGVKALIFFLLLGIYRKN